MKRVPIVGNCSSSSWETAAGKRLPQFGQKSSPGLISSSPQKGHLSPGEATSDLRLSVVTGCTSLERPFIVDSCFSGGFSCVGIDVLKWIAVCVKTGKRHN